MYISELDANGDDMSPLLDALVGQTVRFTNVSNLAWIQFRVTGFTDYGTWRAHGLTFISQSAANPLANNGAARIAISGDPGIAGATGATGPTGPAGATGPGVPSGGATNAALVKASATSYDTRWSASLFDITAESGAQVSGVLQIGGGSFNDWPATMGNSPVIFRSTSGGSGYPFNAAGRLVIGARADASSDLVLATRKSSSGTNLGAKVRIKAGDGNFDSMEATNDGGTTWKTYWNNGNLPYAAGTFTPTLGGSTTNPSSVTYTTQVGQYVRIGRLVYFTLGIATSAYSGGTGNLRIKGLPFTASGGISASPISVRPSSINWTSGSGIQFLTARVVGGGSSVILERASTSAIAEITLSSWPSGSAASLYLAGSYMLP